MINRYRCGIPRPSAANARMLREAHGEDTGTLGSRRRPRSTPNVPPRAEATHIGATPGARHQNEASPHGRAEAALEREPWRAMECLPAGIESQRMRLKQVFTEPGASAAKRASAPRTPKPTPRRNSPARRSIARWPSACWNGRERASQEEATRAAEREAAYHAEEATTGAAECGGSAAAPPSPSSTHSPEHQASLAGSLHTLMHSAPTAGNRRSAAVDCGGHGEPAASNE